jgi:hypothetical protein
MITCIIGLKQPTLAGLARFISRNTKIENTAKNKYEKQI